MRRDKRFRFRDGQDYPAHDVAYVNEQDMNLWTACGLWLMPPEFYPASAGCAYVAGPTTCLWCVVGRSRR